MSVYSSLVTKFDERPMYNGGQRTRGIDKIIIHHNATTNPNVALNTWVVGSGSYTSAHYEITDSDIIVAVEEDYIAYHAAGTGGNDVPTISDPNGRSIGLEHVNSSGAPDWQVSDATLHNSARLIADICKRYNLPINRNTIMLHREVTSTACPGGLDIDKLIRYALDEANGNQPQPNKTGVKDMLLFKADKDTKYGKEANIYLKDGETVVKMDSMDSVNELKRQGVPFTTLTIMNTEQIINKNGGVAR